MCDPLSITVGIASAVSGAAQANAAKKQRRLMKQAMQQQEEQFKAEQAERQAALNNLVSQEKVPNVYALSILNRQRRAAATQLTGPAGVDPNALLLGRKVLFGG